MSNSINLFEFIGVVIIL